MKKWMLALHAHLPMVLDIHPTEEEQWLWEAVLEVYLPLLRLLREEKQLAIHLTCSFSPLLLDMMASPFFVGRFRNYVEMRLARINTELEPVHADLAFYLREQIRSHMAFFEIDLSSDILAAIAEAEKKGQIELHASNATHAYTPIFRQHMDIVRGQVVTGANFVREIFPDARVQGAWSPECAYFRGLERVFLDAGLTSFFVDAHAYMLHSPYASFVPVNVDGSGVYAIARDLPTAQDVWDRKLGYPAHAVYREFHRNMGYGVKPFAVTGQDVPLGSKQFYDPARAQSQVQQDAAEFVRKLSMRFDSVETQLDQEPLICSAYDMELFGHWWAEGIDFLREVFRLLPSYDIQMHCPSDLDWEQAVDLQPHESSWGEGGYHETWVNAHVWDMYPLIQARYADWCNLVQAGRLSEAQIKAMLAELLWSQISDWAFMVTANSCRSYATERFMGHIHAFDKIWLGEPVERAPSRLMQSLNISDFLS